MSIRKLIPIVLLSTCLRAEAASLGEGVDERLNALQLAALPELEPVELLALDALSDLFRLRSSGLLPPEQADDRIARGVDALALLSPRAKRSRAAWSAFVSLEQAVVAEPLRELLDAGAIGEGGPLALAVDRWLAARGEVRSHGGKEGPENTCFLDYWHCLEACSNGPTWPERTACGLDCYLDLVVCLATSILPDSPSLPDLELTD